MKGNGTGEEKPHLASSLQTKYAVTRRFQVPLPTPVRTVLQQLTDHGYESFLVGGCVRDIFLSRPVNDYDVATNASPDDVRQVFAHTIPTGIAHGTVTVLMDGMTIEVTTYRVDGEYSDGRHPDAVRYTGSLVEDLRRRDFTMNAMAMSLEGWLVDPFAGQTDLHSGLIRAVGDAEQRFSEDALRMVRAVRFAAQLGFAIDTRTHEAMLRLASGLEMVSMERVGQELLKIARANWFCVLPMLATEPYLELTRQSLAPLQEAFSALNDLTLQQPHLNFSRWRECLQTEEPGVAALALWLIYLPNRKQAATLFRSLAWPNRFTTKAFKAADLVHKKPQTWSRYEWRKAILDTEESILCLACVLSDWLIPDIERSILETMVHERDTSPLTNVSHLAVGGKELVELGFCGPAIGQAIAKLTDAVIRDEVTNDGAVLNQFLTTSGLFNQTEQ